MSDYGIVPDRHVMGLVEYTYIYGLCPYCNKPFDEMPGAEEFAKHINICILNLDMEMLKSKLESEDL